MTEKKTSSDKEVVQEPAEKKVKAKTGSWWKSSVTDVPAKEGSGQEQTSAPEVVAEPRDGEKKPARRPARPRRKKTDTVPDVTDSGLEQQAGEKTKSDGETTASGQDKSAAGETVGVDTAPEKKPARRAPRPRRKKTDIVPGVPESGLVHQAGEQEAAAGKKRGRWSAGCSGRRERCRACFPSEKEWPQTSQAAKEEA
jgi:hypothetical protein